MNTKSTEDGPVPPNNHTIDKLIHEPARLTIVALLSTVKSGDFTFLMTETGFTWGNLSSHMSKLEQAGYVEIEKRFVDNKPQTIARLSRKGRRAFTIYKKEMARLLDLS